MVAEKQTLLIDTNVFECYQKFKIGRYEGMDDSAILMKLMKIAFDEGY